MNLSEKANIKKGEIFSMRVEDNTVLLCSAKSTIPYYYSYPIDFKAVNSCMLILNPQN